MLRPTPPEATAVRLPKPLLIKPAKVVYNEDDSVVAKHIRDKFAYFNLRRITKRDLRKLNISSSRVLSFEEVLVKEFVPPSSWLISLEDPPVFVWQTKTESYPALLLNGVRRPEHKQFYDVSQELGADLKNVYHSLRRDPPKEGHTIVSIRAFRKFWNTLHQVGTYWDDSLDNLEKETEEQATMHSQDNASRVLLEAASKKNNSPTMLVDEYPLDTSDMDIDLPDSDSDFETQPLTPDAKTLTYTGRRTSTGSKMPAKLSMDLAESFLEPLMYLFGCHFDQMSRSEHRLHVVDSVIPCSNTKFIYSRPKDNSKARKGMLEGPVAVLHAYTYHGSDSMAFKAGQPADKTKHEGSQGSGTSTPGQSQDSAPEDMDHFFRELKALLLCAQERSRDDKRPIEPGYGHWWSRHYEKWGMATDNGAGNKPGEAVGEPLTDLDLFKLAGSSSTPATTFASARQNLAAHLKNMTTEETSQIGDQSDWGPSGRSDQEDREEEDVQGDQHNQAAMDPHTICRQDILAWTATNQSLDASKDLTTRLGELPDSDNGSTADDEGAITSTRKRSFATFTGYKNGNDTIESEAIADPSQSNQNTSTVDSNVDVQNRDEDGVLDMDAEWATPTHSSTEDDVDMMSSSPSGALSDNIPRNPALASQAPTEHAITGLNSEDVKKEWYRCRLMEERESQEYEKRKRLHGVAKANNPGRTLFTSTYNEYKRIGISIHDSHDDVSLLPLLNL